MKTISHHILLLLITVLFAGALITSCDDEDDGTPVIHYVRVTNPEKSDSLLTGAYMGNLIAIVGENLGDVQELWFNDQQANLIPTYITDNAILVTVPSSVPDEITNTMLLIFSDGRELLYDFSVNIPAPVLSTISCEYVPDGGSVILTGDYFFNPTVIFPGDVEAKILEVTKTQLEVEVPAGTGSGPIVVKTKFGKTTSSFFFRDSRGVILDFDTKMGAGWRPGNVQSTNPDGASGNYVALTGELKADWDWVDNYLEMDFWGQASGNPEGPLFKGNPADMVFKFEVNVVNDWTGGWMQLIFSPWSNDGNTVNSDESIARALWRPWEETGSFKTDGWITVSIPLTEFKYNHTMTKDDLSLVYPDNCGSLTIFVWGLVPEPCDLLICIDNVRIVPE
ncbi:MAG: hypothetical protein JXR41_06030 [Bacteroidales bacterium]|nr:hypothetical protein [Bacteroidales bacterium]